MKGNTCFNTLMSGFEKGFLTEIKTTIMKGVYQDPEVKHRYMAYGLGGIRAPKVRSCFGIGQGLGGIGEPKVRPGRTEHGLLH